jgi:microcystin-dependent protein
MDPGTIGPAGGSFQPHSNMMPFLGLNFCIAVRGIHPHRG